MRAFPATVISFLALALTAACSEPGPMEKAGERADEAVEEAGEVVGKAVDKIEDAAEETTKEGDESK